MASNSILAFVLAGGEGTRLHPLTRERAKPALGFAGGYRLIDFVLSNLVNSGLRPIYILAQYKPNSVLEHVAATWGPRVKVLLPRASNDGGYTGTATAVQQNMDVVEREKPDLVAVFAADHVYRMDVRQMAGFHRARRAQVSVAAVAVPIESAQSFGVIATGRYGQVREFQEKP
ncbi:MAG: sugar phosphate nucleotidyltransferase, partial [Burkholderiales bacterium]